MNSKNMANKIVKESITEALLILMKKKDYSEITISELTKVAGVGRVSFYRNYKSKDDILIQYMIDLTAKRWNEKIEGIEYLPDEKVWEIAFELFELLLPTVLLLKKSNIMGLFYEFLSKLMEPKENESIADSYRKSIIIGLFFSVYDNWIKRGMQETPKQLAEMFKDLNIKSIK